MEAANKVINHHLKTRLCSHKGAWADELPSVLWAYKMTSHNATGKMPYFLAFRLKVVVPVEIRLSNYRTNHFSREGNNDGLRSKLDLLEEKREVANL